MPKEVMRRTAADNPYLHKDFHGAMSCGIQYLHERFGAEAVREYLRRFTDAYHAPLKAALRQRGLPALAEYLDGIYRAEGAQYELAVTDDELVLRVQECPAISHMRSHGYAVADLWVETTRTVYAHLCEGSDFDFELQQYDPLSGASVQRFFRRQTP